MSITQEEMEKKLLEARQQQRIADFGQVWFTEALAHTFDMVNRGVFPREAHEVGVLCFQQFMSGKPKSDGDEPKKEEKAE
jgi:hypothetical protein